MTTRPIRYKQLEKAGQTDRNGIGRAVDRTVGSVQGRGLRQGVDLPTIYGTKAAGR